MSQAYNVLVAVHRCQQFHEYTNHTLSGEGGGSVKINISFIHLTFWPDFYYFHRDFWHSKMLMCTLFGREEGVSENVWFVHS